MAEEQKVATRDRMVLEALLERRLELDEERKKLDADMAKLRTDSDRLAAELLILDEMLGTTKAETRVTFATVAAQTAPSFPTAATASPPPPPAPRRPAAHVKFRKGSVGQKIWPTVVQRYGEVEFGVDEVVALLGEESPDTKHTYEAAWRLCNELIERKVLLVTSQSKSGRGFTKRFRIAEAYGGAPAPAKPEEPKGIGLLDG
jgi:hypothetical protein